MDTQQMTNRGWSIIKKVIAAVIIAIIVIVILLILLVIYLSFAQTKQTKQAYPTVSSGMGIASPNVATKTENLIARDTTVPQTAGTTPAPIDQTVIKTGSLDIMVDDVEQTVTKITNEATTLSGFVQNSSVSETTTGQKYANLVIRVPVKNFETMISKIKAFAKLVQREDINGQEVTQEYVDLQSALTHNLAVEAQYLELLKRAQKVEEIIAVREKLDEVQAEIENLKGRIRYLDNQTEMSTISVNISSEAKVTLPAEKWQPWEIVKQSAQKLIVGLQNFVNFIIVLVFALIALIPYIILILVIVLLIKWLVKKYRKPKQI